MATRKNESKTATQTLSQSIANALEYLLNPIIPMILNYTQNQLKILQ